MLKATEIANRLEVVENEEVGRRLVQVLWPYIEEAQSATSAARFIDSVVLETRRLCDGFPISVEEIADKLETLRCDRVLEAAAQAIMIQYELSSAGGLL